MKKGSNEIWISLHFRSAKGMTEAGTHIRLVTGTALLDGTGSIRSSFSKHWPDEVAHVYRHDKLIGYAFRLRMILHNF